MVRYVHDFCQSRLSGLSLEFGYVHILYPEASNCVPAVDKPKLVTEAGLVVCQYDRLSQQQLSFLVHSLSGSYKLLYKRCV